MTSGTPKPDLGPYKDIPDFIYGITREIWEDRGIGGKLDRYYAADILLRAATGLTTSNHGVTGQTLQTLHQFPDRQLVGEDVIFAQYDDGSFLSSHRLTSVMHHQGDGIYGRAKGGIVRTRIIADCFVRDGQVKEEWLVRDQAAFARCLGMDAPTLARQMTDRDLKNGVPVSFFVPAHDRKGHYTPQIQPDPTLTAYCDGWHRIWDIKDMSGVRDLYFHGAALHAPGGDVRYGHVDIDAFCLGYLASFPEARFTVESATINRDPGQPVRIAMRWSLNGQHSGFGHFGEPGFAPIHVMGFSHAHIVDGKVTMEWTVTDEVSIWKQIFAHQESRAGA